MLDDEKSVLKDVKKNFRDLNASHDKDDKKDEIKISL